MESNLPRCRFSWWPWAQADSSFEHEEWNGWFWYFQRRRCFAMRCTERGFKTHLTASRIWGWYDNVVAAETTTFGIPLQGDLSLQRSGWDAEAEACDAKERLPLSYEGGRASIGANWPNCNLCGTGADNRDADAADGLAEGDDDDGARDASTKRPSGLELLGCSSVSAMRDPRELARDHAPFCVQAGLSIPSIGDTLVTLKAPKPPQSPILTFSDRSRCTGAFSATRCPMLSRCRRRRARAARRSFATLRRVASRWIRARAPTSRSRSRATTC